MSVRLHVNIDHVATVRNARGTSYPDPVLAAQICELHGASGITAHLREDRRHITDRDVERLRESIATHLNLEMAATEEMLFIAERVVPDTITLVPERREERTTEGGLDVHRQRPIIDRIVAMAQRKHIRTSLFIAPDEVSVKQAKEAHVDQVELHTGEYCHACAPGKTAERAHQLDRLVKATELAHSLGLEVAAGHGLTRHNVGEVVAIPNLVEVNIGHSVVADAVLMGIGPAVAALKAAIDRASA